MGTLKKKLTTPRRLPKLPPVVQIGEVEFDVKKEQRNAVRYSMREVRKKKNNVLRNLEGMKKLHDAGLWSPGKCSSASYVTIQVDRKQLPMFCRVLGCPLKKDYAWAISDTTARVQLRPTLYPGIELYYEYEPKPTDKCRIVTTTTTSTSLVCDSQ